MKRFIVMLLLAALPVSYSYAGRCSGGANCRSCKNCNYCGHCNSGGDCSVCNPDKYNGKAKPKPAAKKPASKPKKKKA